MKKILRLFLAAAILLSLFAIGLVYLNRVVLPKRLKQWVEQTASSTLGRPVTIERIRWNAWHGLMAEGIVISENPQWGSTPIVRIERLSGAILMLPLLKHREIFLPTLYLHGGHIRLIRSAQGRWNLEDWLAEIQQAAQRPQKASPFRLLIPKVVVRDAQIEIESVHPLPIQMTFDKLQAEVHLKLPAQIEATLETSLNTTIFESEFEPYTLTCQIDYTPTHRSLKAKGRIEGPLSILKALATQTGRLPVETIKGDGALEWKVHGNLPGPWIIELEGQTIGLEAVWRSPSPWHREMIEEEMRWRWTGDLDTQIRLHLPSFPLPEGRESFGWQSLQPTGSLTLRGGTIGPIPMVEEIRGIAGEILISPQAIRTESLQFALPTGPVFHLTGSLLQDEQSRFGIRVTGDIPIAQLPPWPAKMERWRTFLDPSSQIQLDGRIQGHLRPTFGFQPTLTATIEIPNIALPQQPPLKALSGTVHWQPPWLTFTNVRGQYLDRPFTIEGSLVYSDQPEVNFTLDWDRFSMEGQLTIAQGTVVFNRLHGRVGEGSIRATGELRWPYANLLIDGNVQLEELPKIWPKLFAPLQPYALQATTSFRCLIEGHLLRMEERSVTLKLNAPSLSIRSIPFQQVKLELNQRGNWLKLASAKARFAQGTVEFSGNMDMSQPTLPWNGQLILQGVHLDELASYVQWKTQQLSGQLALEWQGHGEGRRWAALAGKGSIQITGARILELPFLGPFANLLGLPSLEKIAFHQAQGTFVLEDGRFRTEDFQCIAPQAALAIQGFGGYLQGADSPIEWHIRPTLSDNLIPETAPKIGQAIAKGAGYLIGEVQVSGTWRQPKKRFVPKPVHDLINQQLFNLQDLLEGLF